MRSITDKTGLKLTIIHFDSMENRNPIYSKELGIFMDSAEGEPFKTAYTKVQEFLNESEPLKAYIGWDKEIYPQYKVEEIYIK